MRVMLVSRVWPAQRGGGMPYVAQDRAEQLAKMGHDVHVVTTSRSPTAGEVRHFQEREQFGFRVYYTETPAHEWSAPFTSCCVSLANVLRPDVIHSESIDSVNPWLDAFKDGPRITATMHGLAMGGWLTKWNGSRALGWAPEVFPHEQVMREAQALAPLDAVLGVSKWEWRVLRDQYGLKQAKLVYNPIPWAFFEPRQPLPRERSFLCATITGNMVRGFDRAERAAHAANAQLCVARKVGREQMPALYDASSAVLLPTAYCQGFDLTIAEGRARGRPAILTPTGSYLDEAEPWDTFVELGDREAMVNALRDYQEPLVPEGAADRHRPDEHARAWLEAVTS